ncbi:MAG: hypothetical protein ACLFWR_10215 [Acidimicrobiales bacterium]
MELTVATHPVGFEISDRSDRLVLTTSADAAGTHVFERVQRRAFELAARKGWLRIHGAVIELHGRRIAVIGSSGVGKTTLALAALAAGHPAEADESFLILDGTALSVPRRFHAEVGTLDLVPDAREWVAPSPLLQRDPPRWAIDPKTVDPRWRTRSGLLDLLVVASTTGPKLHLAPMPGAEAVPHLLANALPTIETRAQVAAQLAALLHHTKIVMLTGVHRAPPDTILARLAAVVG